MGSYRTIITFLRRRQNAFIILLLVLVFYGLIQSFGEIRNSVWVRLENGELQKNLWSVRKTSVRKSADLSAKIQEFHKHQNYSAGDGPLKTQFDAGAEQSFDFDQCRQVYPNEAETEFNTFDIYKRRIAGVEPDVGEKSRSKHGPSKLKVFFLPMTHIDPGWLRTFESYSNDTDWILNNLHAFMTSHPKMRFMWCEIVFFEHWWKKANESVKTDIRRLIATGQLEIASGSWVMTDEANPYFAASVDNIVEGQQFVLHELNTTARTVWSNDPFGYGPTEPYLFSKTGIRNAVINRIHHGIKGYLQSKKAIPFYWRQHFDAEGGSDIMTHVLPYAHYDILNSCGPNPAVCCQFDFKRMTHFSCGGPRPVPISKENVVKKAKELESQFQTMSNLYESNVLLVMWGDDFRYDMIEEWYQHYDNLMPLFDQINSGNSTEVRFGTFADYFEALERFYEDEHSQPATLSGDFFPYQCAQGDHWTGYYTTRPFFKKLGRRLHAMIHAADLATFRAASEMAVEEKTEARTNLTAARRNLALFQHHDAITGTSKKHVMKNYAELLHDSVLRAASTLARAVSIGTGSNFEVYNMPVQYDQLPSQAVIRINSGDEIVFGIWNSLPRTRKSLIKLRVSTANIAVKRHDGEIVAAQIEPYFDPISTEVTADFQLVFLATLEPLSTNFYHLKHQENPEKTVFAEVYYVQPTSSSPTIRKEGFVKHFNVSDIAPNKLTIETLRVKTTHSADTGLLRTLRTHSMTEEIEMFQTLDQYLNTHSGAYLMRHVSTATNFPLNNLTRFLVKGPVRQVVSACSEFFQQSVSAWNIDGFEGDILHLDMHVDIRQLQSIELVTRLVTSLSPDSSVTFTDSNGLQLVRRESHDSLPIEANYYPMPTAFVLQDSKRRISIVSDVEHGARALENNGAEIMLDRKLLSDDGKGLGNGWDGIPDDMLPVAIGFKIIAEELASPKTLNLPKHFAYNSLATHLCVQSTLYEPVVLMPKDSTPQITNTFLQSVEFPCDVQLVSARPLPYDINNRLLVLHRLGVDCTMKTEIPCPVMKLTDAMKNYLKSVKVSKLWWSNLSGTNISAPVANDAVDIENALFQINPMDFLTAIVQIG